MNGDHGDGHGRRWPDGRIPDEPDRIRRRAELHDRRAAARDWQAIAACGLCDKYGLVTTDPGGAGYPPTVAWCNHLTTAQARKDLQ